MCSGLYSGCWEGSLTLTSVELESELAWGHKGIPLLSQWVSHVQPQRLRLQWPPAPAPVWPQDSYQLISALLCAAWPGSHLHRLDYPSGLYVSSEWDVAPARCSGHCDAESSARTARERVHAENNNDLSYANSLQAPYCVYILSFGLCDE